MLTPDHWAHQYVVSANQPYSRKLSESHCRDVRTQGQTYGLEPNFVCCTVNHPQGLPKFVAAMFKTTDDGKGIVHALLGPAYVDTVLEGGNKVTIECETNYPFSHTLKYTTTASSPFTFNIRVPDWALPSSTVSSPQEEILDPGSTERRIQHDSQMSPDPHTGLHAIPLPAGNTTLTITLQTTLQTEDRANNTLAIRHGALLYALPVAATETTSPPKHYFSEQEYPENYAPPQCRDHTLLNASEWAVGIDPSTLKYQPPKLEEEEELPSPLWGWTPTNKLEEKMGYIEVRACEIEWTNGMFKDLPAEPPKEAKCKQGGKGVDEEWWVRLVPFGSAKLHMAEFAVVRFGERDGGGE